MKNELVIVLDFGGQYNQLVARRVRECNVYCEIYSYRIDIEKIKAMNPKGIILTGGPNSCYEADSPTYTKELFELGIPVLGLCYGAQLMMHVLGGKVTKAEVREYGKTEVLIDKKDSKVFEGVEDATTCWMSHLIISHRLRRDLRSQRTQQTARLQQLKMQRKSCTQFSSIRKYFIQFVEKRCCTISYAVSANVQAIGRWMRLLKMQLQISEIKWETAKFCWHCPAVLTLP